MRIKLDMATQTRRNGEQGQYTKVETKTVWIDTTHPVGAAFENGLLTEAIYKFENDLTITYRRSY
jgi:hypothetical protein